MLASVDGLVDRVEKVIGERHLLPDGAGAVVAVSGGVDSMVLLHVLHDLAARHQWKLVVAHFNHQLRGKEAEADERFVKRVALKLKLRFESARSDVKKFAAAQRVSVEMGARQLRHRFLAKTARKWRLQHVLLAHHADDQVELFFVRSLRGSGAQGLGGMEFSAPSPPDRNITLHRPLLGIWKSELLAHAEARGISFRHDTTNDSTDILRNRIRHQLLPLLRKDFQPQVDRLVLRSMNLMRDESDFVTREAVKWMKTRRTKTKFEQLHVALQRRIIQRGLLANGIVPTFDHIEKLRASANTWLTVEPTLFVQRTPQGKIEHRAAQSTIIENNAMTIVMDGACSAHYSGLKIELDYRKPGKLPARARDAEFFDAEQVGSLILLRQWQPGDRFQPIGMADDVKLQDWFVNQKIPRERRHELVIATTEAGEIFWVEGLRIGEKFKVAAETKTILQWRWRKETPVAAADRE